jgi:hypothetical protein
MVSSASSVVSSIPVSVIVAVVLPARILIVELIDNYTIVLD